jgi:hypothetical protein
MTSTTLHSQTFKPAQPLGAGKALRTLATAAIRFVGGIAFALRRPVRQTRRMSLLEEANEVRAMADECRRTDPGFAADLYAAADRHELGGKA